MPTIEDLLKSLQLPKTSNTKLKLENNKETWRRIKQKDSFADLGLEPSVLEEALKEWIDSNPYSSLSN